MANQELFVYAVFILMIVACGYFYFDKSEITIYDMYIIDKIRLLRTDFINFWFSLDNNNKIRFVSMITNYNSVYPQIKIPNNIILF